MPAPDIDVLVVAEIIALLVTIIIEQFACMPMLLPEPVTEPTLSIDA